MASDDDTRQPAPRDRLPLFDPGGGPDRTAWAAVTRRIQPPTFTIDALGTDPPFEMPGSAAQRRVIMNGLYSGPAYTARAVSHDPYPEITQALGRWHTAALREPAGPVAIHPSWSNVTGYSGTGWTIEKGTGEVWSWDAWVPALVVLASAEDRVVGERRCPVCRGRGLYFGWMLGFKPGDFPHTNVQEWSPRGGLAGVVYMERDTRRSCVGMSCDRCNRAKTIDVTLAGLVFAAAQGWPWAREHGSVIADRLQAEGDPWGHWLAAMLEPRQWGGWRAYPKRREHACELAERLDQLTADRGRARGRVLDPAIRRAAMLAGLGFSVGHNVVVDDGEDPRLNAVTRGDTTTLTVHDGQPHTVRTYPVDYRGQARGFREPDEVMSEAVFQRALDRLAHGEPDDDRPVTPPIGRNLERRLNRGRRGRG
jgi:hypothetical protein